MERSEAGKMTFIARGEYKESTRRVRREYEVSPRLARGGREIEENINKFCTDGCDTDGG